MVNRQFNFTGRKAMCYSLCSVHYSLAQPLFGFNCPGSIAVSGSGEWGALLSTSRANILAEPTRQIGEVKYNCPVSGSFTCVNEVSACCLAGLCTHAWCLSLSNIGYVYWVSQLTSLTSCFINN